MPEVPMSFHAPFGQGRPRPTVGVRDAQVIIFGLHYPDSFQPEKFPMIRALSAAGLALALVATPAFAKGDAARGKQLEYTCTGCHGIVEYKNAYPSYRVPKIGGQNEAYLVAALTGYKKGERNHPTMKAQASSFSDKDIADIAAYLSGLKTK